MVVSGTCRALTPLHQVGNRGNFVRTTRETQLRRRGPLANEAMWRQASLRRAAKTSDSEINHPPPKKGEEQNGGAGGGAEEERSPAGFGGTGRGHPTLLERRAAKQEQARARASPARGGGAGQLILQGPEREDGEEREGDRRKEGGAGRTDETEQDNKGGGAWCLTSPSSTEAPPLSLLERPLEYRCPRRRRCAGRN